MLEWDEAKRLENIRRRGLDFEDADLMFDGPPRHNGGIAAQ
jgi:uncharacterized DUF497 family protein